MFKKLFSSSIETSVPLEEVVPAPTQSSQDIIIVSDNHMKKDGLAKLLKYHNEAGFFLHCGDSNLNPTEEVMKPFITVRGNTDFMPGYNDEEVVQLPNGDNILIVHGHKFRSVDHITQYAVSLSPKPQIVLYGHSHVKDAQQKDGMLIINPGSISQPRDGGVPSYVKLKVLETSYDVTFISIADFSVINQFQFQR